MTIRGWKQRWPEWVGWLAVVWSAVYATLGIHWSAGGSGFPFGAAGDPGADVSVLAHVRQTAAPVIAALALVGTIVAALMVRGWGHGPIRVLLLAFAWIAAVALSVVIPDFRVLVAVAYAPILILGAPFDWPERVRFFDVIPWSLLNQVVCIVGGLAWAGAAVVYQRRTLGACVHCGRADTVRAWQRPEAVARWGTWAVVIAVIVPLIYALTRWAWALGIPLGITDKFFREGQSIGLWWRGAALATLSIVGAVLTVGLVRRWGEVFPRWIPVIGSKRVPRPLVVVPAAFVSLIVTAAGLMFIRMAVPGTFKLGDNPVTFTENWAALWPELIWPIWGVALAAATLAYHYRTRGGCSHCGRG